MASTFNPDIVLFNATGYLPLKTRYLPHHWQEGLNIMLEKTPSNFNMEKLLQITLLFETDFNVNNMWLGRAVMMNAETVDLLADEQYGHRHKAAMLQCLNKVVL